MLESAKLIRLLFNFPAPNAILKLIREHNAVPPEIEQEYNEKVAEFASRGFRSLGVAWQGRQGNEEWELLGIVPLFDPPRFDTARTIAEAQDLGVQVKMLVRSKRRRV